MKSIAQALYVLLLAGIATTAAAQDPPLPKQEISRPKVIRNELKGSINHGSGDTMWQRVIGKVRVIDATTLEYSDGTRIELDITVPASGQMAMRSDGLYPCGMEAAEFLRTFIGEQPVNCFQNDKGGPWMGYVGDSNLERVMTVNGWALADHSSMHPDEIIAREHKRGLWQGKFIHPDTWRAGVRLPGEPPPPKLRDEAAARRLFWDHGDNADALPSMIARVVSEFPNLKVIHFTQRGRLSDDGLAQLSKLDKLEVLDIAGCWEVTDAGLVHLKEFPHLKQLSLPHTISDAGLIHIENLTELEKLTTDHWRGPPITDAGLAHLKKLRRLKHLILNGLDTTDAGLAELKQLPDLAVLEFGRMPVGDAGLVHVGQLQNLNYLDLSQSEVTDAGIDRLVGLKQLRVLKLPARVTQKAQKRLQDALPELKFEGRPEDIIPDRTTPATP